MPEVVPQLKWNAERRPAPQEEETALDNIWVGEEDVWDDISTRRLACAVLFQALRDAKHMRGIDSFTARSFLLGGEGLREWCELARVNYHAVVQYATKRWHDARTSDHDAPADAQSSDPGAGERRADLEGAGERADERHTQLLLPAPVLGQAEGADVQDAS